MNIKEIQDIINFIKKTDLDDVSIETENYKIRVKKNNAEVTQLKEEKKIPVKNQFDLQINNFHFLGQFRLSFFKNSYTSCEKRRI